MLLDGGFQNFLVSYPMRTTNPRFVKQKQPPSLYPDLDDIEYGDLDEIKMKPKQTDGFPNQNKPRIDRTSKPPFGQKSMTAQHPNNIISMALKHEKFYDDVLKKEKEALNVGTEYIKTLNTTITPSESDQTEHFNKQTELEYKFIQKENELNDTITKIELNLESLETIPSTEQNPEVTALLARVREKQGKHDAYQKQLEQIDRKREELGPATKEQQKRHLQVSQNQHAQTQMILNFILIFFFFNLIDERRRR